MQSDLGNVAARARSAPGDVADAVTVLASVPVGAEARQVARIRLADTAFAAAVGRRTDQGSRSAALADALHGPDSIAGRAFRLTAACRMTEIDDVDLLACVTPGSIVVPTVLAVLASPDASDALSLDDVLDITARGYEVALGLGECMNGPNRLATGVWPSLAVGAVTAAVVATLLLGGNADSVERAAILASQQSLRGNPRGNARENLLAGAVVAGIGSALAVRRGFGVTGSRGGGALERLLTQPAERAKQLRIHRPSIKRFCSARQTMTAVTALQAILAETGLNAGDLDRIDVAVPHEYASMIDRSSISTRRESLSSAQYQLALAVCFPSGLYDVGRVSLRTDREFLSVMAAVHVHGTSELSSLYPERWPARVRVTSGRDTFDGVADELPAERDISAAALTAKLEDFSDVAPELTAFARGLIDRTLEAHLPAHLVQLAGLVEGRPWSSDSAAPLKE